MKDDIEKLVLQQLRPMRTDISAVRDDLREMKNRLVTLEICIGTSLQQIGHLASSIARQQVNFDRLGDRVERIEKRLELVG